MIRGRLPIALALFALVANSCKSNRSSTVTPTPAPTPAPVESPRLPSADPRWSTFLRDLRRGEFPLFAMGDLDENDVVDEADLALARALAERGGSPGEGTERATCPAAADLDENGRIEERDVTLLQERVASGAAPALTWSKELPCAFRSPIAAAALRLEPGRPSRIVAKRSDGRTDARIVKGEASLKAVAGGWDVEPRPSAKDGDAIAVWLRHDGRTFGFTLFVSATPGLEWKEPVPEGPAPSTPTPREATPTPRETNPGTEVRPTPVPGTTVIDSPTPSPEPSASPPEEDEPPVIVDESPTPTPACPQLRLGCAALVIDYFEHEWLFSDLGGIASGLRALGCDVDEATPNFKKMPKGYYTIRGAFPGVPVVVWVPPDPAAVAAVRAHNQAEFRRIWDAIASHRTKVRAGKQLAFEMVGAHGSPRSGEGCGWWGAGFDTGGYDWISRREFHLENFKATYKSTCTWYAHDISCYSGNSCKSIDNLNNRASPACNFGSTENHPVHAAWDGDLAACADDDTSLVHSWFEAGPSADTVRVAIQNARQSANWLPTNDFSQLGRNLRGAATSNDGHYTDNGYVGCMSAPVHVHTGY